MNVDRDFVITLCKSVRALLVDGFNGDRASTLKDIDSPVTQTDLSVALAIRKALEEKGFQSSEILCEEGPLPSPTNSKRLWIIDPLDGTKEFINQTPEFAVSIAYGTEGKLSAAAIFNPINEFLIAADHGSAILIEAPRMHLDGVICSRSEWKKGLLTTMARHTRVIPVGSIAYKLGLVAAGTAPATVSFEGKNSWDIAAGVFLIEHGGGRVTDLSGNAISFTAPTKRFENGLLATHRKEDHSKYLTLALQS